MNAENSFKVKPRDLLQDSLVPLLIQQAFEMARRPQTASFPNLLYSSQQQRFPQSKSSSQLIEDLEALKILTR